MAVFAKGACAYSLGAGYLYSLDCREGGCSRKLKGHEGIKRGPESFGAPAFSTCLKPLEWPVSSGAAYGYGIGSGGISSGRISSSSRISSSGRSSSSSRISSSGSTKPLPGAAAAFPMLRIDPALPMLSMEPALPMLRIEPTLPMLKMEAVLPILAMLTKLRRLLWLRALRMLLKSSHPEASTLCEALGKSRDRFKRGAAYLLKNFTPLIFLPIRLTRLLSVKPFSESFLTRLRRSRKPRRMDQRVLVTGLPLVYIAVAVEGGGYPKERKAGFG